MNIQDVVGTAASDRELARKLGIAIRAADLGIWEWDLKTNEFFYSDRAKEIFGFPREEPVTRDQIISVLHPEDHRIARQQAERSLDPTLEKREPYRYRIYRADTGELRWIHAFGEPVFELVDGKHVPRRFIGSLQDVTEEVLAKEKLVQQEARLRLAIEASGMAVWELNLAEQTVAPSPELNRLCGFPEEARPTLEEFRSRYAPGERERLEKLGAEARARGETKMQSEIRHLWPDGTEKWLLLRAQLAPGETDYGSRVIGVLLDITEQKKREEQLGLLLAELNHRIKNSFAVTQSIISQTLRGADVAAETRARLFARLQALSDAHDEIVAGAWESVSLRAVLRRAQNTFDQGRSGRVHIDGQDVTLNHKAALTFSLVLHELFTNAMKYGSLSSENGRLSIELVEEAEPSSLTIVWSEDGGPKVEKPSRTGFGTRLIERLLVADLGAAVSSEFQEAGLRWRMSVPLSNISASSAA